MLPLAAQHGLQPLRPAPASVLRAQPNRRQYRVRRSGLRASAKADDTEGARDEFARGMLLGSLLTKMETSTASRESARDTPVKPSGIFGAVLAAFMLVRDTRRCGAFVERVVFWLGQRAGYGTAGSHRCVLRLARSQPPVAPLTSLWLWKR